MELNGGQPIVNFTIKNIREFTINDTIYISKKESGYQRIYLCQFIEFKSGCVKAKVIGKDSSGSDKHHNYTEYGNLDKGDIIIARITKCLLWGLNKGSAYNKWEHFYWFNKKGYAE